MALLLSDDFSGNLSNFTASQGTWSIVSGELQGVNGGVDWVNNLILTNTVFTDFDLTVKVYKPAQNTMIAFRSNTTAASGYGIQLRDSNNFRLENWGSANLVQANPITWSTGTYYKVRIRCVGTSIKARVWVATQNEPGTWHIDTTNATFASGKIGFSCEGGTGKYDDLVISTPVVNPTRSLRFPITARRVSVPRGYNMAGLEFNAGTLPGTESTTYTQNSSTAYGHAARYSANFVRVPISWNRIQPTRSAALDSTYQGYLANQITWAAANGLKILWDLHNYGRYNVSGTDKAIGESGGPTKAEFVDFWNRFATWINANQTRKDTTWGFGLMNEPHDMPSGASENNLATATIYDAYQAAVTEIRTVVGDMTRFITGCTDGWSGLQTFFQNHGANPVPWITDPANRFYYDLHIYADSGNSGSYSNPAWSGSGHSITYMGDLLEEVAQWAQARSVNIIVTEMGAPNTDDAWKTMMNDFYNVADAYGIPVTAWAMGEWWGTYINSLHPSSTNDKPNVVYVTSRHLGADNTSAPSQGGGGGPSP